MTVHRAFVDRATLDQLATAGDAALPDEANRRLTRVLRLGDGDAIELLDGHGRVARAQLSAGRAIEASVEARDEGHPSVTIAQATTRVAKLEEVVRRSTELGAAAIALFVAERSQVAADRLGAKKLDRLARVAEDATRQSGRVTTPPVTLIDDEALTAAVSNAKAAGGEAVMGVLGAAEPLSARLRAGPPRGGVVVIGPEGGLSPAEQERWLARGVAPVALGAHVLRTETASLAALAAFQASWNRL